MVRKLIWLFVWTSIWTVGSAAPLDNENKPKGLKLDIKILHGNTLEDASPFNTPGLVKRSRDSVLELTNMATYYLTDIYVGSNREKCTVQVDTSSSDSWVMSSNVLCDRQSRTNQNGKSAKVNHLPEEPTYYSLPDFNTSKLGNFSWFNESMAHFDDDSEYSYDDEGDFDDDEEGFDYDEEDFDDEEEDFDDDEEDFDDDEEDFDDEEEDFDDDEEDFDDDEEDFDDDIEESEDFHGSRLDSRSFKSISDFENDSKGKRSMSKRDPHSKTSNTSSESTSRNTKTTSNTTFYKEPNPCLAFGSFNQLGSSTFKPLRTVEDFYLINYEDEQSSGLWGSDTIGFANTEFKMIFGVAKSTMAIQGMLGIGPVSGEMLEEKSGEQYLYDNFPQQLKSSGIINKNLYSVFLNQKGAQNGSILFGAVDHKKYSGHLGTVPFVNLYRDMELIDSPNIALSHIYLENEHQKVTILNQTIGAVLDTSSNFQKLPENVVRALAHSLQAQYSTEERLFQVDCGYKHDVGKIVYDFSGIKIRVPVGDLIIESNGSCFLGVRVCESEETYAFGFMGTRFLRNAYVVYNLEDSEISLAQVHYTDEEDVEMVSTSVPRAIKAERYSSTSLVTQVTQLPTEIFELSPKNAEFKSNGTTQAMKLSEFVSPDNGSSTGITNNSALA